MHSQHTHDNVTYIDAFKKDKTKKVRTRTNTTFMAVFLLMFFVIVVILLTSPFLNISIIEVQGASVCKKEDIVSNCGVNFGDNVLRVNRKSVVENLTKIFPYVDTANVSIRLPNKVIIKITERKSVGMVAYMGSYIVVDKDGKALEAVDINTDRELTIIKGINVNRFELGRMLPVDNYKNFQFAVDIVRILIKYNLLYRVNIVDVEDVNSIQLIVGNNIRANISSTEDMEYKINCLNEIIKKIGTDRKGYIDFAIGQNPIFIPES